MPYEEIDRQWVKTREEAQTLVDMLRKHAGKQGLVVDYRKDRGGYRVTVEKFVEEEK
jgi:hypothetical protein